MISIPLEIIIAIFLGGIAIGFIGAVLFLQWLEKAPTEKLLAKHAVKPWPTDERGHPNRRTDDPQEGVKSIHGYQPKTEGCEPPRGVITYLKPNQSVGLDGSIVEISEEKI